MKIDGAKLDFFGDLYDRTKAHLGTSIDEMERNMQQYRGDAAIDGSEERASVVRNITYELIESQVTSDIPAPKVTPERYNERHNRNARNVERLLAQIRDKLPFEEYNDIDERYTYIYGGSVWLIEWDDTITTADTVGGVRVSVVNPADFFPQPNIYRVQDMDYCFLRFASTKEDIKRRYGVSDAQLDLTTTESDMLDSTDEETTATIVVCFYRDDDGNVCKYAFSGDVELEDINDYYGRKVRRCTVCGRRDALCTCEHPQYEYDPADAEVPDEDIVLSDGTVIPALSPARKDDGSLITKRQKQIDTDEDGMPIMEAVGNLMVPRTVDVDMPVMEPTELQFYRPRCFPVVVRRNTSADSCVLGQSDCAAIRPQQQAINKVESRIMQKLMRSGVTPIMPEDALIKPDNGVFGQVIRLRPGENSAQYGTVDTTPNIQQDIAEAERLYQHAKQIIGVTAAYQGAAEYAGQSGEAIQTLAQQSAGRLESKRRMKNAAYADIDRILFEQYLAYADEPRHTAYTDEYGITHDEVFSRYDFLDMDDETGEWHYDDGYMFSVDRSGGMEQQREALWQTNLNNLQSGSLGDPSDPRTLLRYWKMQDRAHYPYASDNVAYFQQFLRAQMQQAQVQAQQITEQGGYEQ